MEQTLVFTNEGAAPCCWRLAAREQQGGGGSRAGNSRASSKMSLASNVGSESASGGNDGSKTSLGATSGGDDDGFKIDKARAELTFSPALGLLEPGEQATVAVVCEAGKSPERVRATIECFVSGTGGAVVGGPGGDGGAGGLGGEGLVVDGLASVFDTQYISLRGEVQAPKVYLDTTELNLGTTYIGVPVVRTVKLKNLSNLATQYKWERPLGDATAFNFTFSPAAGELSEKQELEVTFTFNAKSSGVLNEFFCCHLFGMPKPVGFELKATVKGLVVAYEALEEGQTAPPPLGKVRRSTKKKNERQSHSSICLSVCLSIVDGHFGWIAPMGGCALIDRLYSVMVFDAIILHCSNQLTFISAIPTQLSGTLE